jgi:hypothetical protein
MSTLTLVELVATHSPVTQFIWIAFAIVHAIFFGLLILPRCARFCCSEITRTRIRDATALFYATTSIVLIALLGVDQGPASFTATKSEACNLLVATGLYILHGSWAWACLLRHVSAPTSLRLRWQQARGRQLMDATGIEMSTYRSALAAPAPALLAVPRVDEELGSLGDVYVAAIRAGQSEQVRHVSTISIFFGPSQQAGQGGEAAAPPNQPLDYGDAARDALYRVHGGPGGRARCFGEWRIGGLSIEEKEKLWNCAVTYANVILTVQLAAFGGFSYMDVLRAVG